MWPTGTLGFATKTECMNYLIDKEFRGLVMEGDVNELSPVVKGKIPKDPKVPASPSAILAPAPLTPMKS